MRFQCDLPDKEYDNLHHMLFVCDCGRKSDQMVVELEIATEGSTDDVLDDGGQHLHCAWCESRSSESADGHSLMIIEGTRSKASSPRTDMGIGNGGK